MRTFQIILLYLLLGCLGQAKNPNDMKVYAKIDGEIKRKSPRNFDRIAEGANDKELTKLKKVTTDKELLSFFSWHNGGHPLPELFPGAVFMSVSSSLELRKNFCLTLLPKHLVNGIPFLKHPMGPFYLYSGGNVFYYDPEEDGVKEVGPFSEFLELVLEFWKAAPNEMDGEFALFNNAFTRSWMEKHIYQYRAEK